MKIAYRIFVLAIVSLFFVSCEEGDVFTGSPVGSNLQFETLTGTITTPETHVVSGQVIPVTITLPKSFPVETKVQAIAFVTDTGKRTTKTFVFPAGETTLESTMQVPGGDIPNLKFDMTVEMYLSAITTGDSVDTFGFLGKQYSLTSDKVILNIGDSAMPALNANRLVVRFDFEYPNTGNPADSNNLNLSFRKNGTITTIANPNTTSAAVFGTLTASARYETVNFNNTVAEDATYTLSVFAQKLRATPSDMKYRFVVRYPNDTQKTFYGVLPGMTLGTAATSIPKLQIVKSTNGSGEAEYIVTQL